MRVTPPESADWNAADASYMAMMVPHHRQALDMAELAATQAEDPLVSAIAAAIDTAQGVEILVMADWLVDRDLPEPEADDAMAGMDGMQGMLTEDQLDALAAADGAEFDRLFLEGMIQHHEGAIAMAGTVLNQGEDVVTNELASDVSASQSAEITRMREILARL